MIRAILGVLAAILLLPVAAVARPATHHRRPKAIHCKHGYQRQTRRVKRRRHHKIVHVKTQVCVRRKQKLKPQSHGTTPTSPPSGTVAPERKIVYHAHLDPSFTRDPTDPFKVTYAYSASATSEPAGGIALAAASEPTPLPEGVLTLYSDGILACSKNVGPTVQGGECPVEYGKLGTHTLTTIYTSNEGHGGATETSTETVEPFATTLEVNARYEALATSEPIECKPMFSVYCEQSAIWKIGSLTVGGIFHDSLGVEPLGAQVGPQGAGGEAHALGLGVGTVSVYERSALHTIAFGNDSAYANWLPASEAEAGSLSVALRGECPGCQSATAQTPVKFTPEVREP